MFLLNLCCRIYIAFFILSQTSWATVDDKTPEEKTERAIMFPATSMPDRDWWQALWPNPKDTLCSLDVTPNMIIVDLCCGDGYFTIPLAEIAAKVYGVELDGALLEQAKTDAAALDIQNCQWIQGDAMQIGNIIPELVDYVLIANTFHGIPNKECIIQGIASILKVGGQLSFINWHQKSREETTVLGLPRGPKAEMRMSPSQVEHIVLPLGFELKKVVDVSPYHYGSIFIKISPES